MLDGFSIAGFRSFGPNAVRIGDLSKVNVFIGKNNCGKSNVLRFAARLPSLLSDARHKDDQKRFDPLLDFCTDDTTRRILFGVQIKREGYTSEVFKNITEPFGSSWTSLFPEWKDSIWFSFNPLPSQKVATTTLETFRDALLKQCDPRYTEQITRVLCNYTGGGNEKRCADISAAVHNKVKLNLRVNFVEAFRRITETDGPGLSGSKLIKELRNLQAPELANYSAAKKRFEWINGFLRTLLGETDAFLEIPAEKDEIYVTLRGKVLPLDSLGTGIHELIILASAVTLVDGEIFCIEEPEIHLHPELQKNS